MRVLQGELVVPWVEGLDRLEEQPTMEEVPPPSTPHPGGGLLQHPGGPGGAGGAGGVEGRGARGQDGDTTQEWTGEHSLVG